MMIAMEGTGACFILTHAKAQRREGVYAEFVICT